MSCEIGSGKFGVQKPLFFPTRKLSLWVCIRMSQIRRDNLPGSAPSQASEVDVSGTQGREKPKGAYVPPHKRTTVSQTPRSDEYVSAVNRTGQQNPVGDEHRKTPKKDTTPTAQIGAANKSAETSVAVHTSSDVSSAAMRYIPPQRRAASSLNKEQPREGTLPRFPAPPTHGIPLRGFRPPLGKTSASIPAQTPKSGKAGSTSTKKNLPAATSTPMQGGKPGHSEGKKNTSSPSISFSSLSISGGDHRIGSLRTAPLRTLVPESAMMTMENAKAHWDGTPARGDKRGLSAHRHEFQGVKDQEGNLVATGPASYAELAKKIATKPLSEGRNNRVVEYVYKVNGAHRIAKFDESTNLLVRVDIESKIITLYRMFPVFQKTANNLPKMLRPSKNGMKLFKQTFKDDMDITNKEAQS